MEKETATASAGTLEYLKHFVGLVIDAFQEGAGPTGQVLGPDMAKAVVWNELQRCLAPAVAGEAATAGIPVWLRLAKEGAVETDLLMALHNACAAASSAAGQTRVLTFRWMGPRQPSDATVAYVVVAVPGTPELLGLLRALRVEGVEARDGTYNSSAAL